MRRQDAGKRVFDVVVASTLLLVTWPVLVICFIGTAISLRAWPLFTQRRVGRDGNIFRFVKFRTLPTHAPRYAAKYDLAHLRLPWFSRTLRDLHLDELPQLFLVVTGKMSLVGPRPEMPYLHHQFSPEFAAARTSVRPGCTGLWQVSEHCDRMIFEHPEFDLHYLEHRSLRFDLWIIAGTLRLLLPLRDRSMVSLAQLPRWAGPQERHPERKLESVLSSAEA